ncbi:MAG: PepSY-associated TM helix domain-containing protein [Methylobacter sp.]
MKFFFRYLLNRTVWLKVHLYLALIAGFFFALMGLTGAVSVYREELDELLNPKLVIEQPSGKRLSMDKIMVAVQNAHPNRYGAWTLELPRSPHSMITVWYDKPKETFFELYAPLMVSVNPYTAEVVASRFWGQTAVTWLLDLHTQLNLGRFGWNAVGVLGLLLIFSVGSGVYLWWPDIRDSVARWLPGKRVAILPAPGAAAEKPAAYPVLLRRPGMIGFAFSLHRLLGLLSAPVLLLLAVTGFNLSYPSMLESLTGSSGMEHGETGRTIISTATPNNRPVGLESAEFVARSAFPRAELRRITTPTGESGIYRINLRQSSELNRRHPYTTVWVDRWSGQIREVRDPSQFSSGETMVTWMWPVHTGEAFGPTGRFIWFVSGIGLFVLYVTGLLRWLHRQGKVRDREVDVAALRPMFYRALASGHDAGKMLSNQGIALWSKAKFYAPVAIKACAMLWQRLYAAIVNRQRLEKK